MSENRTLGQEIADLAGKVTQLIAENERLRDQNVGSVSVFNPPDRDLHFTAAGMDKEQFARFVTAVKAAYAAKPGEVMLVCKPCERVTVLP